MATLLHGGIAPLAALTTVFTPPCSTSWLVATTRLPSQFPSFPAAGPTTCDPPAWASNLAAEAFLQYYSPAICPDGFSVGPGCSLGAKTRTAEGFPAVAPGETVAWCVPRGQTCASDTTDFRGGIWGVAPTAAADAAAITVGPAMQIRWRDADLTVLATHPLTPGLVLGKSSSVAAVLTTLTAATETAGATATIITATTTSSSAAKATTSVKTIVANTNTNTRATTTLRAAAASTSNTSKTAKTGGPHTLAAASGSTAATTTTTGTASSSSAGNNNGSSSSSTGNNNGTITSASTTHTSPRAFAATIALTTLLSLAALALGLLYCFRRRRRRSSLGGQYGSRGQSYRLAGDDGGGEEGSVAAVGLGAWVRRPTREAAAAARRSGLTRWGRSWSWWPSWRRDPSTLPPTEGAYFKRRLTFRLPSMRTPPPAEEQAPPLPTFSYTRPPQPFMRVELPAAPVERSVGGGGGDRVSIASTTASSLAEEEAEIARKKEAQRHSMHSLRSTRSTHSTRSSRWSRWSRWTRTTDGDDSYYAASEAGGGGGEASWEAFSRAQGGMARLVTIIRRGGGEGPQALRVAPVPPMPAMPAMSEPARVVIRTSSLPPSSTESRSPTPSTPMLAVPDSQRASSRFSRLSEGTFGRATAMAMATAAEPMPAAAHDTRSEA